MNWDKEMKSLFEFVVVVAAPFYVRVDVASMNSVQMKWEQPEMQMK